MRQPFQPREQRLGPWRCERAGAGGEPVRETSRARGSGGEQAPQRQRARTAERRAALPCLLHAIACGLPGLLDALAALPATNENRRAHVLAPLETVIPFAPAEHAVP